MNDVEVGTDAGSSILTLVNHLCRSSMRRKLGIGAPQESLCTYIAYYRPFFSHMYETLIKCATVINVREKKPRVNMYLVKIGLNQPNLTR